MATHIVTPGEFFVTDDSTAVIETSLGSCVGVALFDPGKRIGSMLHVLLPSGSEEKEKTLPARFASSGLPLLLSEMVGRGARRERITAVMAGGALILTDRALSLEMNIGKKNSDMVRRILDAERIPLLHEDVGGHVVRLMRFKPSTGETEIHVIGKSGQVGAPPSRSGGEIDLGDLKIKIDKLKPLPEIARKIMLRVESSGVTLAELERDIVKDQALTANVLKICNSPWYGFQQQISSIKRALMRIGLDTLKKIVLTSSFHSYYDRNMPGYSTRKGDLMKHSVCCALVAELIAAEKGVKDTDVAFTAGLLHDIGKVVLDQYAFEKFNLIVDRVNNGYTSFLDAENQMLGYNHAVVGGLVARVWNLPEVLIDAISHHHEPERHTASAEIVSAVHLADSISSMFGEGCGVDAMANRIHQFAISTLDLRIGDVERIVEKLPDVVRRLEAIW